MRRTVLVGLLALGVLGAISGCSSDPTISRVGVNVVDKSLFDGSWYMARTVVGTDYESAGFGTFTGDSAGDYASGGLSIPRIRWVIDEKFLYAYRDVPLVPGADTDTQDPNYLGQPVAAFKIVSHFDIRRDYDPVTGQEKNVVVENAEDKRWYERRFMRVDWTQNMVVSYNFLGSEVYELLGIWSHETAPLYIGPGSNYPANWQPSFDFMTCGSPTDTGTTCRPKDRDFAGDYPVGQLYHMSFVTQEVWSPGMVPDPYTGVNEPFCMSIYSDAPSCNTATVYVRTSFLRLSGHDYEPVNYTDTRFDRFGYFRNEQPRYDRSEGTPGDFELGVTDFRNYTATRFPIWRRVWERDAQGRPDHTREIPLLTREVRPIVWYTTPDAPAHLIQPVMSLTADWNLIYMDMVRRMRRDPANPVPVYQPQDCQRSDPSGYCYCLDLPDGTPANATCPGIWNPYNTPQQEAARLVSGTPYQCSIVVPAGAEPEESGDWTAVTDHSFYGWYGAHFDGSECVTITRVNNCNRGAMEAWQAAGSKPEDRPDCQERGDLRYHFLAYIDEPGTPFLGVATLRGDPITGEMIAGDANIGGPALDSYRTRYMYMYDLLNGNLTESDFIYGEDIRSYFETLNHVEQPAAPQVDFLQALDPTSTAAPAARQRLQDRFQRSMDRVAPLMGPDGASQTYTGLLANLRGTETEQRLVDNPDTLALAGMAGAPEGAHLTDQMLDRVSPVRMNIIDQLHHHREVAERAGFYGICNDIAEFSDDSVVRFVRQRDGWPRQRVMFEMNRALYRGTQLHEMGHMLGLRHDFGGTADRDNYLDGYYQIDQQLPLPHADEFDANHDGHLDVPERNAFTDRQREVTSQRVLSGIYRSMNSSIMDYTADFGQRTGEVLGRWDSAAINFGYSDMVEVSHNTSHLPFSQVNPVNTPREYWKWYAGGETCSSNDDCPYSTSGVHAGDLVDGQVGVVSQHCGANPISADGPGACSNYDEDFAALVGANPENSTSEWLPTMYRFCTDDQVGRLGWCHRFDNGDSYREIVRYASEQYDRYYIFNAFRRYRATFDYQTYFAAVFRQYDILEALFQSMFYQYVSGDRQYTASSGPWSFADQYAATVDAMNLFVRILAQPSVGVYAWNDGWHRYEKVSSYLTASGDFALPLGQAKYDYTIYQRGLTGINRLERIGILYDRIFALQLLAARGGNAFRRDFSFLVNYYDLFPTEMQQLFNGMIRDDPTPYSSRVICGDGGAGHECPNPRLVYMDLYRGDCTEPTSPSCRPDPVTTTYAAYPTVNAGVSILAQIYGAMFGLTNFPTYFDATFQRQLFLCIEGQGNCNVPTADAVEGRDYVRYHSQRFSKTYLAFNIQNRAAGITEPSIGFQMVGEARNLAFILEALQAVDRGEAVRPELQAEIDRIGYAIPSDDNLRASEENRIYGRLYDVEGFFTQLLQLENDLGIRGLFRF